MTLQSRPQTCDWYFVYIQVVDVEIYIIIDY
jgi:hypothetical protein